MLSLRYQACIHISGTILSFGTHAVCINLTVINYVKASMYEKFRNIKKGNNICVALIVWMCVKLHVATELILGVILCLQLCILNERKLKIKQNSYTAFDISIQGIQ